MQSLSEVKAFVAERTANQMVFGEYMLKPKMLDVLVDYIYAAGSQAGYVEGHAAAMAVYDKSLGRVRDESTANREHAEVAS